MPTPPVETRPYGVMLRDLLLGRDIVTAMGNPNWTAFVKQVRDVEYESLRKAITGERWPSPKIMEKTAEALGVEPQVFREYQLWLAQRVFDPREVGEDEALANLKIWLAQKT